MTIEHKDIANSQLHEPKNIGSSGTSDAGKVLTPSASISGTSVLRKLTASEIDNLPANQAPEYGIAGVTGSATTLNLAAGDLALPADYVNLLTVFNQEFASGADFGVTAVDTFTVASDGVYSLTLSISLKGQNTDTGVAIVAIGAALNDLASTRVYKTEFGVTESYITLAITERASLVSGDTIGIFVAANKTTDLVVESGTVSVVLEVAT